MCVSVYVFVCLCVCVCVCLCVQLLLCQCVISPMPQIDKNRLRALLLRFVMPLRGKPEAR